MSIARKMDPARIEGDDRIESMRSPRTISEAKRLGRAWRAEPRPRRCGAKRREGCNKGALVAVLFLSALTLSGCKEHINPHIAPEADPEVFVTGLSAATLPVQHQKSRQPGESGVGSKKTVLTLNNAPAPNELFELEIVQRLVELFEQRHPDIQIEFSTWRFTPESFYERARSHTLTDVVEVTVDQMQPIIDLSLAADMTIYLTGTPELQSLNPSILELTSREGRLFGVPIELQTMAIFYNRSLVEPVLNPKEAKKDEREPSGRPPAKKGTQGKPSKGGSDEEGRIPAGENGAELKDGVPQPLILAQVRRYGSSYYDYSSPQRATSDEADENEYTRRGEQQIENEYQVAPRPRFRWPFRVTPVPRSDPALRSRQPIWRRGSEQEPVRLAPPQATDEEELESARPRVRQNPEPLDSGAPESARPQPMPLKLEEKPTTTPKEETITETVIKEDLTTAIRLEKWPRTWEEFVRLAVQLTDHEKGLYGYAPVLFASEGGREFVQWCVLAGLEANRLPDHEALQELRGPSGNDAIGFLRDMRWRYDMIPPPEKCYSDNILRMFAEGKVAMIMLPATKESVRRLMRAGMPPDHIGIAPLPQGPANRQHLVFGRCLIVNSQTDESKRRAAAEWIRFLLDPEVLRMREQYLFREQDLTGIPRVPLYRKGKQDQVYQMLKSYRLLPVFADYEDTVTSGLMPEPARLKYELYEELAREVRPALEKQEIDVGGILASLGLDVEKRMQNQGSGERPTLEYYIRFFALPRK